MDRFYLCGKIKLSGLVESWYFFLKLVEMNELNELIEHEQKYI